MTTHQWAAPNFSRTAVDQAGLRIASVPLDKPIPPADLEILDNWRAAHAFPLNTFQVGLRSRSARHGSNALVVQRLKRVPTIRRKLTRFPKMRLTQMQDLGGCRAVVADVDGVRVMEKDFRASRMRHALVRHDDYIATPDKTGYRGVHLVYRYSSRRRPEFERLLIEVQLRSRIQHAWATAVETVGTFLGEDLKEGSGPEDWLEYFRNVSAAFALLESCEPVPGAPSDLLTLAKDVTSGGQRLEPIPKLAAVAVAMSEIVEGGPGRYFLLDLRLADQTIRITPFLETESTAASDAYLQAEEESADDPRRNVVLVSADSVIELKRGYPNYFADVADFSEYLTDATKLLVDRMDELLAADDAGGST